MIGGVIAHLCYYYKEDSSLVGIWAVLGGPAAKKVERFRVCNLKDSSLVGGWSSPAMPLRYAEAAKIANEGIKLPQVKAL